MSTLRVEHLTRYEYDQPVGFSQHVLRLLPGPSQGQRVIEAKVRCTPEPDEQTVFTDFFGNAIELTTMQEPHERLDILATSLVERDPAPALGLDLSAPWEEAAAAARTPAGLDAAPHAFPTDLTIADDAIEAYTRTSFSAGRPVLAAARELTTRICNDFTYAPGTTKADTRPVESFAMLRGVCQDYTHVMIAGLRSLGVPARYVSGYLRTLPSADGAKLTGSDASHAWLSVWDPGHGWIDFDPTNDLMPGEDHVALAHGRDYTDAAPIAGLVIGSGGQTLHVAVTVEEAGANAAATKIR